MTTKLLTCLSIGVLSFSTLTAQTLFTFGSKPVSQTEFVRAFEKNPDSGNRKTALAAYLPLYINYKLKVQDALDKKMDTLMNQQSEASNYRTQLEESFMNEKANADRVVQEAFDRSQKDILMGHLFIGFDAKDSVSVAKAADQAAKALAALRAKQDFASVVNQYSTDENNKKAGGQAGWITVFSIPYHYENAIYGLSTGGYSEPIKGSTGFHIFKKIAERPAAGRVRVAQIMLVNADKANTANEEKFKLLADSLYQVLEKGAGFDTLAQKFSNDRTSYGTGGNLPEFGVGSYDPTFEQHAFGLKNKGEISQPFQTSYGWHILKLLDKFPVSKTLADADVNGVFRQKVLSGGRTESAKALYLKSQLAKIGYKASAIAPQQLWQYTDSAIKGAETKGLKINGKTPVLSFGTKSIPAVEWVQYVKNAKAQPGNNKSYTELLQDFTLYSAEDFQRKNLEKLEPSFAMQLKEFKEANLLFEAMDKNVWSKAATDSTGLYKYYQQHKDNYKWGASAAALLVTSTDSAVAEQVLTALKSNPADWKQITGKYNENLIADSGRYELSQIPVTSSVQFAKGMITTPVKNEIDGSQTFALIFDLLPNNTQRSFEEARGFVINDYQGVLEEKWLAGLKKKYPVKVNEVVWQKLLAQQ